MNKSIVDLFDPNGKVNAGPELQQATSEVIDALVDPVIEFMQIAGVPLISRSTGNSTVVIIEGEFHNRFGVALAEVAKEMVKLSH